MSSGEMQEDGAGLGPETIQLLQSKLSGDHVPDFGALYEGVRQAVQQSTAVIEGAVKELVDYLEQPIVVLTTGSAKGDQAFVGVATNRTDVVVQQANLDVAAGLSTVTITPVTSVPYPQDRPGVSAIDAVAALIAELSE